MSTVKEYYAILEDTLVGGFLQPWDKSERKKARSKFYFFDCGVVRAIQNRLNDPPTPVERGLLFENWFIREMLRMRDYYDKPHEFTFWREGNREIDLLISDGHGVKLAVECKSGRNDINSETVDRFRARFPKAKLLVASMIDKIPRITGKGIEILPWFKVLEHYISL